jgi:hypothetical protein
MTFGDLHKGAIFLYANLKLRKVAEDKGEVLEDCNGFEAGQSLPIGTDEEVMPQYDRALRPF